LDREIFVSESEGEGRSAAAAMADRVVEMKDWRRKKEMLK